MDLTELATADGRGDDAARALEAAIALYERKGNVVMVDRARALRVTSAA